MLRACVWPIGLLVLIKAAVRDKLQVAKKSADVLATCRYEEKIASEQDRTRALNATKRGIELQMDYYLENRMSYREQVRRTIVTWQLERKAAAKAVLPCSPLPLLCMCVHSMQPWTLSASESVKPECHAFGALMTGAGECHRHEPCRG